jgi:hypothetical protein
MCDQYPNQSILVKREEAWKDKHEIYSKGCENFEWWIREPLSLLFFMQSNANRFDECNLNKHAMILKNENKWVICMKI